MKFVKQIPQLWRFLGKHLSRRAESAPSGISLQIRPESISAYYTQGPINIDESFQSLRLLKLK